MTEHAGLSHQLQQAGAVDPLDVPRMPFGRAMDSLPAGDPAVAPNRHKQREIERRESPAGAAAGWRVPVRSTRVPRRRQGTRVQAPMQQPWSAWEERFEFDEAQLRAAAFDRATPPAIAIRLLTHVGHESRLAIMRLHGWTLPQLNVLTGLSNEHYLLSRYISPMNPAEVRQMAGQLFQAGLLSDTIILRALAYGESELLAEALHLRTRFSRQLIGHVLGKCDHVWLSILANASAVRTELRSLFVDLARAQAEARRKPPVAATGHTTATMSGIVARYLSGTAPAGADLDGLLSMAVSTCIIEDLQVAC
jgi:hypothetical protein